MLLLRVLHSNSIFAYERRSHQRFVRAVLVAYAIPKFKSLTALHNAIVCTVRTQACGFFSFFIFAEVFGNRRISIIPTRLMRLMFSDCNLFM